MHVRRQKKVLVLGFMFREPVGGVVWQTLHYLLGLRRLGFDCYYLECHGHWVPDPAGNPAVAWVTARS